MTKDTVEQIWTSYLQAYGNVSADDRRHLLAASVSDDVLSTNPGDETQGLENLLAHVEQFQQLGVERRHDAQRVRGSSE